MVTKVKCICEFCGKEFETSIAEYNRFLNGKKKHICCSKLCANRLRGKNHRGENNPNYNSIKKICLNCGKEYTINKGNDKNSKFCCRECKDKYRTKQHQTIIYCLNCGKEMLIKQSQLKLGKKFCSRKCAGEYRDRKVEKTCVVCGKKYKVHRNQSNISITCSTKCQHEWLKIYSSQPEVQERLRKQGTKTHLITQQSYTKPELIVMDYFQKNNIDFIPQFVIGEQLTADFYLPKYNCIFEVYGDYWHANPKKFGNGEGLKPLNEIQKRNKKRDYRRYKVIVNQYNYYFYYMWEDDIINNLEESMKKFFKYIDTKIRRDYVS